MKDVDPMLYLIGHILSGITSMEALNRQDWSKEDYACAACNIAEATLAEMRKRVLARQAEAAREKEKKAAAREQFGIPGARK